ncbi:MAG: hypothetical protein ABI878_08905 [Acidobacteriota bacterium]
MTKKSIKIIKQNREPVSLEKPVPAADKKKVISDKDREVRNTVKNWISERRENSDAERGFSATRIFSWNNESVV